MVTLHAVICENEDSDQMVRNIKTQLKQRFGLDHATIEIERGVAPTRHPPKPRLEMSETNNTLISVEDLSVDFRAGESVTNAVRNVSFDIGKAETVALVGESGSRQER